MNEELKNKLIALAKKWTPDPDDTEFDPGESGNYGDAYEKGISHGEIYLARDILTAMGIGY